MRNSEIHHLYVNGNRLEGVEDVKKAIFDDFYQQFSPRRFETVYANLNFKRISKVEREEMVRELSKE